MLALFSLLLVVALSLLVNRVATVALVHTGLSLEAARFQARSAFTGVGFTTSETESVVQHPVRRRIILTLMLLGNAGVVTVASSLILTFVPGDDEVATGTKLVVVAATLAVLWALASSAWFDRHLSRLISAALARFTRLDVADYASLLHLAEQYRVMELAVREGDWLAGRTLAQTNLRDEGVVVLGIQRRPGCFLGAPVGETVISPGDVLFVYGKETALCDLARRERGRGGDEDHRRAVDRHAQRVEEEREIDSRTAEAG